MAQVILFRPREIVRFRHSFDNLLPFGLLTVAGPLLENRYTVKIIDEELTPRWEGILKKELRDSVICAGVSALTGSQITGGLRFSRFVKNHNSKIPVVWGGVHASMLPEQTLRNEFIDVVVRGEGENALLKAVNAFKEDGDIKGIENVWYKSGGDIYSNPDGPFLDLNKQRPFWSSPLLDYEKYISADGLLNCRRHFFLIADKGCPHRCTFCYNLNFNKGKWRGLSAANVLGQLKHLSDAWGIDGITFIGDNFFTDKKRVYDICEGIVKQKIKIVWRAYCRVDYFSRYEDSFIELLKRSGCRRLAFGIESGSQRILDALNKDTTLDQIFEVNEKAKKWGIVASYSTVVGFPQESRADVIETYKLMKQLSRCNPRAVFLGPKIFTPYPGTPLYEQCIAKGFKSPQRLEDWARFDYWSEKTNLDFIPSNDARWLGKSIFIMNYFFMSKKAWLRWWFFLRAHLLLKFGVIGLLPERKILQWARALVCF